MKKYPDLPARSNLINNERYTVRKKLILGADTFPASSVTFVSLPPSNLRELKKRERESINNLNFKNGKIRKWLQSNDQENQSSLHLGLNGRNP